MDTFSQTMTQISEFFKTRSWTLLLCLLVWVVGIILVKLIVNVLKRVFRKTKLEKVTQGFVLIIIKYLLDLLVILGGLKIIGVELTGILTALSAVLLAIGLALQNSISNVANGIVIISTKMFKQGDYIAVNGIEGCVDSINFFFVSIITTDNKKITIPNSSIVNNEVTNYGANATRRINFDFQVAYESDVELVKKVIIDVMKSNGKVLLAPKEPFCRLKTLDTNGITFFANCWVDAEDYWDVYYYIVENVFNEFKRNGITIPYNQLEIRNRVDGVIMPVIPSNLPEREEKIRLEKERNIDLESDNLEDVIQFTKEKIKATKEKQKKK